MQPKAKPSRTAKTKKDDTPTLPIDFVPAIDAPAPRTEIVKLDKAQQSLMNRSFTKEQIKLIKDTVAKGTTDLEFQYFLYVCQHRGLDPLLKQLHVVKRSTKARDEFHFVTATSRR